MANSPVTIRFLSDAPPGSTPEVLEEVQWWSSAGIPRIGERVGAVGARVDAGN